MKNILEQQTISPRKKSRINDYEFNFDSKAAIVSPFVIAALLALLGLVGKCDLDADKALRAAQQDTPRIEIQK